MSGDLEIKTIYSVIVKYDLKVFKLVNEVKN